MLCEKQERLLRELKTAITEHAELVEQILVLIQSDEPREGFQDLVLRAAESKGRWEIARNELTRHRTAHGC